MCGCCHMGRIYRSPCMCKALCIWKRRLLVFSLEMSCLSPSHCSGPLCQCSRDEVAWWSISGMLENVSKSLPKYSHYFLRNSRWAWEVWIGLSVVLNIASAPHIHVSLCCKKKCRRYLNTHWKSGATWKKSQEQYWLYRVRYQPKLKRVERVATEDMIHLTPSVIVVAFFWKTSAFVRQCNQQWTSNDSHQSFHSKQRNINWLWQYKRSRQCDGTNGSNLNRSNQSQRRRRNLYMYVTVWSCYRCSHWTCKYASLAPQWQENRNYRLRGKLYRAATGKSMITYSPVGATIISDRAFFTGPWPLSYCNGMLQESSLEFNKTNTSLAVWVK